MQSAMRNMAGMVMLNTSVSSIPYEDAEPVRLTQNFLQARERFLRELLSD